MEKKKKDGGGERDIFRNWFMQFLETSKSQIWREVRVVGWSTNKHRIMPGTLMP